MADRGHHPNERDPAPAYGTNQFARLDDALREWDERPAAAAAVAAPALGRPQQVGPYRVLEIIGEGGMGSVYKAEQVRPVRRVVALKLVKPGLDSREVLARFEAERQALARMDHPHIAKVLDAGADELGRPYFVMEYVPGTPIARFCDDNKLTIRQRLELFIQVCDAIAHAHTKSVLHRDIKSSNVLAYVNDGKPTVKVIDFGVAKALTSERLTEITFSTDRGAVIGTYDSMSPEQADGSRDIDTRTDVYALGVLLYQLLTGAKPFDKRTLAAADDHALRRMIRDVEPPRPSARVTSLGAEAAARVAEDRQTRVDSLARALRGELEWIPMMAMRKERERRYASPLALADDVRNYLAGRPLAAGPESKVYVATKFVKRHRAALGGVATGLILLTAASIFYLHRIRAEQAKTLAALARAQEQTEIAEKRQAVAEYERAVATNAKEMMSDMLTALNPARARGREVKLEDVLRESAKRVEAQFKDQPDVEAQLRTDIARTMFAIGHAEEALPHYRRALELRRRLAGPDAAPTALAGSRLGHALIDLERYEEAETLLRPAFELCRLRLPPDEPARLQVEAMYGVLLSRIDRNKEAEPILRAVFEQRRTMTGPDVGPDGLETLTAASNLGLVLNRLNRNDEAERLLRDALERRLRIGGGADDPATSRLQHNLGQFLWKVGREDEARELQGAALEMSRRMYPEGHPDLVTSITSNALLLQNVRRSAEAEALAREAYATGLRAQGADHPRTIEAQLILQRVLTETGRADEAIPLVRDAVERRRRLRGPDHAETRDATRALAVTLKMARRPDESAAAMRDMVASARRAYGDEHKETMVALMYQAILLRDLKRYAEQESVLSEVIRLAERRADLIKSVELARWRATRAISVRQQGRLDEAEPLLRDAMAELREHGSTAAGDANLRWCMLALADVAEAKGRGEEAARLRDEARETGADARPATRPATHPATLMSH